MTQTEALKLALEALQDNQHLVADNERHAYVMEYNDLIEKCKEALAQPEQEPVAIMREMLEVQGQHGNWNYDSYMHGLYNGMEYMVALAEKRETQFRDAPETWLAKYEVKRNNFNSTESLTEATPPTQQSCLQRTAEQSSRTLAWVGLTDEERSDLWEISRAALPRYATYASLVEAKLKEKNT